MPGTKQGGLKCAATNKQLYGDDFYVTIGRAGGRVKGTPKGFATKTVDPVTGLTGRDLAKIAGQMGGRTRIERYYLKHGKPTERNFLKRMFHI